MSKTKEQNAITLIALVITIMVLVILASVAIYLSLGNNGIFNKAKEAKELTNKQEATEKINLKITTAQMNKYAEKQEMPTLKELSEVLKKDDEIEYITETTQIASKKYEVGENPSSIYTKLNDYPYEFEINSSLQLASINGIKVANGPSDTSNNPKGEMRFSDGDNGFKNAKGKLRAHSYGIEAEEFELDSSDSYMKATATKDISCNLPSKFEISSQIFLPNVSYQNILSTKIRLYNKNDIVAEIQLNDGWAESYNVRQYMQINSNVITNKIWNTTNASSRYAIVGDGEKAYAYWGNAMIGSIDYTGGLCADKVEITFQYYSGYSAIVAYIEDMYIGEPYYYREFV